ncbi:MAG: hypothetical protein KDK89_14135 [Alphaproteobacteria bacterium]|nr:hypothetical protein [Alphaproteobacteria bacterium]
MLLYLDASLIVIKFAMIIFTVVVVVIAPALDISHDGAGQLAGAAIAEPLGLEGPGLVDRIIVNGEVEALAPAKRIRLLSGLARAGP